jgi:hypothetical protein
MRGRRFPAGQTVPVRRTRDKLSRSILHSLPDRPEDAITCRRSRLVLRMLLEYRQSPQIW